MYIIHNIVPHYTAYETFYSYAQNAKPNDLRIELIRIIEVLEYNKKNSYNLTLSLSVLTSALYSVSFSCNNC